jgi:hypothetical protein
MRGNKWRAINYIGGEEGKKMVERRWVAKPQTPTWRDRKEWLVLIASSTEWWRGILADGKEPASMI